MGIITNPSLSYSILVHNETNSLKKLLFQLLSIRVELDQIVIVDDFSENEETREILFEASKSGVEIYQNHLNGNFANQKNFMTSVCKNKYILNIDADELLSEDCIKNYKTTIEEYPDKQMFRVPRINIVSGIRDVHIKQWKWNISKNEHYIESKVLNEMEYEFVFNNKLLISVDKNITTYYVPIINYPDYQMRLYRNFEGLKWVGKVHEVLHGFSKTALLPSKYEYSLIHIKDIKRQEQQNQFYGTL